MSMILGRKNILTSFVLAAALFLAIGIGGCGYHVVGKGDSSLFTDMKSMAIPVFDNDTRRADIESTLTHAVVDEFINLVEITEADKAEAVLEGRVIGYSLGAVSFTGKDVVNEYRLTVVLSLRLVRGGEVIWEDKRLSDYEDFIVDSSDIAATREAEEDAFEKLADDMARLVREHMLEGF